MRVEIARSPITESKYFTRAVCDRLSQFILHNNSNVMHKGFHHDVVFSLLFVF